MMQINDAITAKLNGEGFAGGVNDSQVAWLQSLLITTVADLNTLWGLYLNSQSVVPFNAHLNDRKFTWYTGQGAIGDSLPDTALDYWERIR